MAWIQYGLPGVSLAAVGLMYLHLVRHEAKCDRRQEKLHMKIDEQGKSVNWQNSAIVMMAAKQDIQLPEVPK